MKAVLRELGVSSKILILQNKTRFELRVSNKKLYEYLLGLREEVATWVESCNDLLVF